MRKFRDSFLRFLADELNIPVHSVRTDPNDPSAEKLEMNAVNVQFLDMTIDTIGSQQVVIDVIHEDENTVVDWVSAVAVLLTSSYYIPVLDYTNPNSPGAVGGNVIWDRSGVRFRRVLTDDTYCRYSCLMSLRFGNS